MACYSSWLIGPTEAGIHACCNNTKTETMSFDQCLVFFLVPFAEQDRELAACVTAFQLLPRIAKLWPSVSVSCPSQTLCVQPPDLIKARSFRAEAGEIIHGTSFRPKRLGRCSLSYALAQLNKNRLKPFRYETTKTDPKRRHTARDQTQLATEE